jgi:GT2 family glycosyltransferase
MEENKLIYAIVPTHGAGDAFIECIQSLLNQTQKITQIIIVDNNVKDGSIDKLTQISQFDDKIKIISLTENTGVTGGRNAGIKALPEEYKYALFVDHDMIAQPSMLEELLRVIESKEDIGIVTPKIYYYDNKNIIWSAGTDVNMTTGQTLFRGGEDHGQFENVEEVAVAPATFLVKKEVIKSLHQFDTVYFATYEDTDFCFRAKKAGFRTYYSPSAITFHKIPFDPLTSMVRLLERTYYVARNRIIFMKKFSPNYPVFLLHLPIYFIYYLLLSLKYKKPNAIIGYIRGSLDGLLYKV